MPVRFLKQIFERNSYLYLPVPKAISQANERFRGWSLSGNVVNHFNNDKDLIQRIEEQEQSIFRWIASENLIILTDNPLTQKYGFCEGDYLETVFYEFYSKSMIEKWFSEEERETRVPIFPERMIEEFEFDPNQSNVRR